MQLHRRVDHRADEVGSPRLAGPLRCDESDRRPLTSQLTEKTRDECLRREAPWVLSDEGGLEGIDCRCLGVGPPPDEATDLSVEASREEIDCGSTPPLLGETEVLRIELEIRRVLPPSAEQIGSPVLDSRAMDYPEGDAELVCDSPQPVSHFGEES